MSISPAIRAGGGRCRDQKRDWTHWHCDTCAVDVKMVDGPARGRLIELAWDHGWSIGIAPGFLHLDRRTAVLGLPQTTWLY